MIELASSDAVPRPCVESKDHQIHCDVVDQKEKELVVDNCAIKGVITVESSYEDISDTVEGAQQLQYIGVPFRPVGRGKSEELGRTIAVYEVRPGCKAHLAIHCSHSLMGGQCVCMDKGEKFPRAEGGVKAAYFQARRRARSTAPLGMRVSLSFS